jgi:hypothetical protein
VIFEMLDGEGQPHWEAREPRAELSSCLTPIVFRQTGELAGLEQLEAHRLGVDRRQCCQRELGNTRLQSCAAQEAKYRILG